MERERDAINEQVTTQQNRIENTTTYLPTTATTQRGTMTQEQESMTTQCIVCFDTIYKWPGLEYPCCGQYTPELFLVCTRARTVWTTSSTRRVRSVTERTSTEKPHACRAETPPSSPTSGTARSAAARSASRAGCPPTAALKTVDPALIADQFPTTTAPTATSELSGVVQVTLKKCTSGWID